MSRCPFTIAIVGLRSEAILAKVSFSLANETLLQNYHEILFT